MSEEKKPRTEVTKKAVSSEWSMLTKLSDKALLAVDAAELRRLTVFLDEVGVEDCERGHLAGFFRLENERGLASPKKRKGFSPADF
jgi:hypothetical protein